MDTQHTTTQPADLGFAHVFEPGTTGWTLLLLHGTGGDEHDLLAVGRQLAPGAALLSPRGKVSEGGALRFFRRLAVGRLDIPDLLARTDELAGFVRAAAGAYGFDAGRVIALGFSNGANIAASLLLRRGAHLRGAVLLSPMLPFEPETLPTLAGVSVFIGAGQHDPMASREIVERLETVLRDAGADVTMHWTPAGHSITKEELAAAQEWMVGVAVG
jgi:phospholipase/carboxylesterase